MDGLTYCEVSPDTLALTKKLFAKLCDDPATQLHFRPHPLTDAHAEHLCNVAREDYYLIGLWGMEPVAYGILRGWDSGYKVPSVGMAVVQDQRSRGFATAIVQKMITVARDRQAEKILVHVDKTNVHSRRVFDKLGFVFDAAASTEAHDTGWLTLHGD